MIFIKTFLNTEDNSGAKKVMCIRVLKQNAKFASFGDLVLVVVKRSNPKKKIRSGDICRAILLRSKSPVTRFSGVSFSFERFGLVLLDKAYNPIGNRIFGPCLKEFRSFNYKKLISLVKCIF